MLTSPESPAQRIATIALDTFDKLPPKCKPRIHENGLREWTPLSAVIVGVKNETTGDEQLRCVSLATGTKCLSASQVRRCDGMVLHDCHAETLALRGFNRWLLQEMKMCLQDSEYRSDCVELDTRYCVEAPSDYRPFKVRQEFSVYLFSTTAPCGDASMDLLISSSVDQKPWAADTLADDLSSGLPLGRGHFTLLGAVRRKPARRDAEATMSKSCTDKIALKQFLGLLAFPADVLMQTESSLFLKGLVVYQHQYNKTGYNRAFGPEGRLESISRAHAHFFDVHVLAEDSERFDFDKEMGQAVSKVANVCALFIAGSKDMPQIQESLVNGVKQGHKQFGVSPKKASAVSRRAIFALAQEICALQGPNCRPWGPELTTYTALKNSILRQQRLAQKKDVVSALKGWVSNSAEDDFRIEHAASFQH